MKEFKNNIIWIILAIVVLVIGFLIWNNKSKTIEVQEGEELTVQEIDHIKGGKDAKVTLIEFGDFQCPACATYSSVTARLHGDFGDDLRIIFRHFPLRQIHINAQSAAEASEAAANQGKFWEMHDLLFNNQADWAGSSNPSEKYIEYAESLGLDIDQFNEDRNSQEVRARVERDVTIASKLGLRSTPTFFLDGEPLTNARSYTDFRSIIAEKVGKTFEDNPKTAPKAITTTTEESN